MVSFGEAVKSFFVKGFDYKTRSTRAEYWWACLFYTLVNALAAPVAGLLIPVIGALALVFVLFPYLTTYLLVPLLVRRFHDTGRSGKWVIILGGLYLIYTAYSIYLFVIISAVVAAMDKTGVMFNDAGTLNAIWETYSEHALPHSVVWLLIVAVSIWFLIWALLPSTMEQTKWDGSVSASSGQQGYVSPTTAPYGNVYNGPLDFAATSAVKAEFIRDESEELSYVAPNGSEAIAKSAGPVLPPAPVVYPPGHPLAPSAANSMAPDQPSGWVRPVVEREEEEFNESGERVEKEPEIVFPLEGFTPPALTENPFK